MLAYNKLVRLLIRHNLKIVLNEWQCASRDARKAREYFAVRISLFAMIFLICPFISNNQISIFVVKLQVKVIYSEYSLFYVYFQLIIFFLLTSSGILMSPCGLSAKNHKKYILFI
jgi:hypothetical protein